MLHLIQLNKDVGKSGGSTPKELLLTGANFFRLLFARPVRGFFRNDGAKILELRMINSEEWFACIWCTFNRTNAKLAAAGKKKARRTFGLNKLFIRFLTIYIVIEYYYEYLKWVRWRYWREWDVRWQFWAIEVGRVGLTSRRDQRKPDPK